MHIYHPESYLGPVHGVTDCEVFTSVQIPHTHPKTPGPFQVRCCCAAGEAVYWRSSAATGLSEELAGRVPPLC